MVCLERGVRQTVPSLLRNIHDLQYGIPPPPTTQQQIHVFTTIKTKRNRKDQSSSPPPTPGSFKTPLRSVSLLSEHFHRYWMSLVSSLLHPRTHREGSVTKATVPTGSSSSCYKIPDRQRWIAGKWHPKQRYSPSVLSFHRGKASCDRPPSVFSPSPRAGRIYVQSVSPLWCIMAKSLFTGSVHHHPHQVFSFFFVFFAVTFQLLLSSKQVLLKDSH